MQVTRLIGMKPFSTEVRGPGMIEADFDTRLCGSDYAEESVRASVEMLERHPLIQDDVRIWGFIVSVTGELRSVRITSSSGCR